MDAKGRYQLLRKQVRRIDQALELGLTDEEKGLPHKNFSAIIASIAEKLSEEGEIIKEVEHIEELLCLEGSLESSLVTRLEVSSETLSENSPGGEMLKDITDLIGDALLASDTDLRKKFETLRFQLARIDPSSVNSVYKEAYSSVLCA